VFAGYSTKVVNAGTQLGLDPRLFLNAISGGAVDAPVAHAKGTSILDETPSSPSFGVIEDVGLMLEASRNIDFDDDLISAMRTACQRAGNKGYGEHVMAAAWHGFTR
jgi:3-hydroxyisobutyrate dehydrogenase